MKIWQRYFLGEMGKLMALVLGCFYLLFIVVDFSLRTKVFAGADVPFGELISYYGCQFSKRATLLIPFALLLATIKALSTANAQNELVALLGGGLPLKKLMGPFLLVAGVCAALLYANTQFVYPTAVASVEHFEDQYLHGKKRGRSLVNGVRLEDGSHVVYQSYDSNRKQFFDAYWLRTPTDIYRMKWLDPHAENPSGQWVDHLVKGDDGSFVRAESTESKTFSEMHFGSEDLFAALVPAQQLSFGNLLRRLPPSKRALTDRETQIVTHLSAKLATPLICFLIVLGVAPVCVRFGRQIPVFSIYAASIGAFLAFLMLMDAAVILGENQVLSPTLVVWAPLLACAALFTPRFARL